MNKKFLRKLQFFWKNVHLYLVDVNLYDDKVVMCPNLDHLVGFLFFQFVNISLCRLLWIDFNPNLKEWINRENGTSGECSGMRLRKILTICKANLRPRMRFSSLTTWCNVGNDCVFVSDLMVLHTLIDNLPRETRVF